jgi:lipoprotein-releasing system permease protein
MYKYLLCWRYLRTRYIALASIISVLLGVATMIVVNSVMAGFSEKMRTRLHGILADVVVESYDLDGFLDSEEVMARIKVVAGDKITAMAPTMETFGLMKFQYGGQSITRQVQIIGIRPEERARTGDFAEFLTDGVRIDEKTDRRIPPSFEIPDQVKLKSPAGSLLKDAAPDDPFNKFLDAEIAAQPQNGAIIGYALATVRRQGTHSDEFIAPTGTKIGLVFPKAGKKPEPGYDDFTVIGYFKSGMSEYDSSHVYVPLERLQKMRLLMDPQGRGAVNQIQVKVKPGVDIDDLSRLLQTELERLRPMYFRVATWEQKQGPLLAAVAIEQSILNMLLFFIIAVAGFGILAIFSMIVVEKTRDIGIMKALGASTSGVRGIFLGYGLLLGLVGSGIGMAGGLLFVRYINDIEKWISQVTGHKVFDDAIYYFNEIPTRVEPWTVAWIVGGALFISAVACIWPAQRAARLHPVRALRYE